MARNNSKTKLSLLALVESSEFFRLSQLDSQAQTQTHTINKALTEKQRRPTHLQRHHQPSTLNSFHVFKQQLQSKKQPQQHSSSKHCIFVTTLHYSTVAVSVSVRRNALSVNLEIPLGLRVWHDTFFYTYCHFFYVEVRLKSPVPL